MKLSQKQKFWLILVGLVISLTIMLFIRGTASSDNLVIENTAGESSTLNLLSDIFTIKGINFAEFPEHTTPELSHNINILKNFYEKYSAEKGKSLVKVLYLDDIIRRSKIRDINYDSLTFTSVDGASIRIQPRDDKDQLILLTLEKSSGKYSLRLVMPEDDFSQRWLKNIVHIEMGLN